MKRIIGNPVGVPNPQSDFAQGDPTKADYIKNLPSTLSGYGITDAYTKEETQNLISKYDLATLQAMYNEVIEPSPERWFVFNEQNKAIVKMNTEYEEEYSSSEITNLVIPYSINGIAVEEIGTYGDQHTNPNYGITLPANIEHVRLPNCIKIIYKYAFEDNKNIKTINIPTSCEQLWNNAFTGCEALENVITPIKPNYELYIGGFAFEGCKNLNNIDTIIDGIKTISMGCFSSCGITNVTISESTDLIEFIAFRYNDKLNSITILNPDCVLEENAISDYPEGLIIKGYKGSTAEAYANANGILFVALDENIGDIETAVDHIIAIQNNLMGVSE